MATTGPTALLLGVVLSSAVTAGAAVQPRSAAAIVADILRADYEGDLARLLRLYEELSPPGAAAREASRVRYWRGFARWRRAMNGANDGAAVGQMRDDLQVAEREFEAALAIDPEFVDATAGRVSAIGLQLFLAGGDQALMRPLIERVGPIMQARRSTPQDNPRMIWVLGQSEWRTPPGWSQDQVVARQDQVIASYRRGLDLIRAQKTPPADALEPRWGEPELLMNLAWSSLNRATPDLAAAEGYAREALQLVPHWHYVRDILLPQIERARKPRP